MAETVTFRSFHRAGLERQAEDVPDPGQPLTGTAQGATSTQAIHDMRARRQAARIGRPPDAPSPAPRSVSPLRPAEPVAEPQPVPERRPEYGMHAPLLDFQLLGLSHMVACAVHLRPLGEPAPPPTAEPSRIEGPQPARVAPWSGLAYDSSSDGRTGLAAGTRVLTARGEVRVEDLVPGDAALALRGPTLRPVTWIGRSISTVAPVGIAAGALGPGRPRQPLRVGGHHMIFIEAIPIAAGELVNGGTIQPLANPVELFHVDIGPGEILLAEGMPLASATQ